MKLVQGIEHRDGYIVNILKYGSLTTLVIAAIVVIRFFFNIPIQQPFVLVDTIVLCTCMFFSVYLYKKRLNIRSLSFKKIFFFCLGMGVVFAITYAVFFIIYSQLIDPEISQRYYALQGSKLLEKGIAVSNTELKVITSSKSMGTLLFVILILLSAILSLIVAAFMHSSKKD